MKLKTKLFGLLALLLMLCTVAMSAKKVHTLGDSTMAPYDESATVTRGWGMYFGNRPGMDGLDKSLTETVTYKDGIHTCHNSIKYIDLIEIS